MKRFGYAEADTQKIVVFRSEGRGELRPQLAIDLMPSRPDVISKLREAAASAALTACQRSSSGAF